MENNPKPRRVILISRTKLIIGVVVLIILAAIVVIGAGRVSNTLMGVSGNSYGMMEGNSISSADIPAISFGDDYGARYPSPYPSSNPDITDTREFLKVSYSAQIQTRKVEDMTKDVRNTVRDFDGRVDSFSSSEKYGYVSFVVAKDKFEQFKEEIEELTHKKLYTENVSSQNLLGQKQSIEQQKESIETRLAQLEKQKKDLASQHASRVASLQSELAEVRTQISKTKGDDEKAVLRQQESSLMYSLDQENKTYTNNNNSLVTQIAQQKKNLEGNTKQDTQFENNIETVSGSVNVNWVSCWEIMKIYSPIHPTIIIVVLALGLLYFLNRKAYLPKVEVV